MPALPSVDIVIIGLNSAHTLPACLASVDASTYPRNLLRVIYADGGSADGSREIVDAHGSEWLDVPAEAPAPGRQRNAGWRAGSGDYVQFLDSDTQMDPSWLSTAVAVAVSERVGAVCGDRREVHPEESVFNWIGDIEWNGPAGEAEAFGGDVLISRKVLQATGGYDPDLIAGEDPELSYRVRRAGFRILKLVAPMTLHDLSMTTIAQYWRRSYRTGHAFAEVNARHPDFWAQHTRRIVMRAAPFLAGLAVLPFALLSPWVLVAPILGTLVLLRPRIFLTARFESDFGITARQARIYGWHASLVVVPHFLGMLRFHWGRVTGRPLTNRRVRPSGKE